MDETRFRLAGISNPRLAQLALAPQPAWLWSADGSRVLWCNAAAAAVLGQHNADAVGKPRGPADPYRRQVARMAERIPAGGAERMERMRGFGAPFGQLATCICSRLTLVETETILIVGAAASSRPLPLAARAGFIADGFLQPVMAFTNDGARLAANPAAMQVAGPDRTLADLGLHQPIEVIPGDPIATVTPCGHFDLHAVGAGKETGIVALIEPFEINEAAPSIAVPAADPATREMSVIDPPGPETEDSGAPGAAINTAAMVAADVDHGDEAAQQASEPASEFIASAKPLRFVWRTDAENRFSIDPGEFSRLIGSQAMAAFDRPWREVAQATGIDPDGQAARAFATRETWNGVVVQWPRGAERIALELSGVPVYDPGKNFVGYRGFGICRDVTALERAAEDFPSGEAASYPTPSSLPVAEAPAPPPNLEPALSTEPPTRPDIPSQREPALVERPKNVLPFRPANDARAPSLSAVENHAFDEIARRLSTGLDSKDAGADSVAAPAPDNADPGEAPLSHADDANDNSSVAAPAWLAAAAEPPRADSKQHRLLFELMPTGILIYRLDRLLYANKAFLEHMQFPDLHALQDAGGLDALYAEPDADAASSTSDAGMPLKIAAPGEGALPRDGRLVSIAWDGEPAHALILSAQTVAQPTVPHEQEQPVPQSAPQLAAQPVPPIMTAELSAMLDSATDGILLFDRSGSVMSCNRSAEALFGYPRSEFVTRNLTDLLADESQRIVLDYFESIDQPAVLSVPDHGREILGRARDSRFVPLSMTMGRIGGDGERFFAVFRDLSPFRKTETDLLNARRRADRATSAKADALAKINHEVRGPLNTIIGFANLMIDERFGPLGNERYAEYLKDMRGSAERVLAMVNDVADISRMETGKLNLSFASQSLNEIVEQCVGALQAQATRDRIIIRTSLTHKLPPVIADGQALRQIASTLITSSIRLSRAGGQVIVSTALGDTGGAVLRVRDMGAGMNEAEIAATMDPYRIGAPLDRIAPERSGIDLSLSKALAEANHAQFRIKSTAQAGTLIEVCFPNERAMAS